MPARHGVQNPQLSRRTDIIRSRKRMVVPETNSFFAALSRETFTRHGYNPSCVIIDELHAHKDRDMYDVLVEGTDAAREQQVVFIITTAGIYDKNSIGWEVHQHAMKVKEDPSYDPTFLPVIYAADKDEDWGDEKVWKRVNPSYPTSSRKPGSMVSPSPRSPCASRGWKTYSSD